MKRTGIEKLPSGVEINWDSHITATNPSAKNNYQRKIKVTCANCKQWRWINSCAIKQIRLGKQRLCWKCHCIEVGKKNRIKSPGRRENQEGYIIRSWLSFSKKEQKILEPMMRNSPKRRRMTSGILEHRAIMALNIKRPLTSDEIVHHINGIKDDNRIENLKLLNCSNHSKEHNKVLQENFDLKKQIELLEKELRNLK